MNDERDKKLIIKLMDQLESQMNITKRENCNQLEELKLQQHYPEIDVFDAKETTFEQKSKGLHQDRNEIDKLKKIIENQEAEIVQLRCELLEAEVHIELLKKSNEMAKNATERNKTTDEHIAIIEKALCSNQSLLKFIENMKIFKNSNKNENAHQILE